MRLARPTLLRSTSIALMLGAAAAWGLPPSLFRAMARAETTASASPVAEGHATAEAMVKFRDAVSATDIAAVNAAIGAEVVRSFPEAHRQWVRARARSDRDLIRTYELRPEVEWAQEAPNRMRQ
jgi:hypothetical protein